MIAKMALIALIHFFSYSSAARSSSLCMEFYTSSVDYLDILTPPNDGVGIKAEKIRLSKISGRGLIDVNRVITWNLLPQQEVADIPGDPRWGLTVLGNQANLFGFFAEKKPGFTKMTIPTLEHGNWAIDHFNQKLEPNKASDQSLPLRLIATKGIESDRIFLKYFVDGFIPVGTGVGRTYLHDINFHFLASIILKPEIIRSMQRRIQLILNFESFYRQLHPEDKLMSHYLEKIIMVTAARLDLLGNVVRVAKTVEEKDPEAGSFAKSLLETINTDNDQKFIKEIFYFSTKMITSFDEYAFIENGFISTEKLVKIKNDFKYHNETDLHGIFVRSLSPVHNYLFTNVTDVFKQYESTHPVSQHDYVLKSALKDLRNIMENPVETWSVQNLLRNLK